MSENKDLVAQAKNQMQLSERIAAALPGFRGYKEKELRRESDKLIRNHLYLKLSGIRDDLKDIFQKLADRRYSDVMEDMDRLIAKMDRVDEKVNHTSYGYTGFFDVVKVKEDSLDRMIGFDNQLLDGVNHIRTDVDAFKADLAQNEYKNSKDRIQTIVNDVESFEGTLDSRDEVILGVS
jgi:uncharacterized protein Yka (UPF0111/DUF47 family)